MNAVTSDLLPALRMASKRATMLRRSSLKNDMEKARKITAATSSKDDIFDDGEAFLALACDAMSSAAKKAKADNDRRGLATPYGGRDGKVHFSQPTKPPTPA